MVAVFGHAYTSVEVGRAVPLGHTCTCVGVGSTVPLGHTCTSVGVGATVPLGYGHCRDRQSCLSRFSAALGMVGVQSHTDVQQGVHIVHPIRWGESLMLGGCKSYMYIRWGR